MDILRTNVERSLSLCIDDELDDETAALFRLHTEECPDCAARYTSLVRVRESLLRLKAIAVPGDFRARFWQRVHAEEPGAMSVWNRIARWATPVSLAFSLLIALFIVSLSVSPLLYAAGSAQSRREAVIAACGTFVGWNGSSVSGMVNFSCFCDRCDMRTCTHCATGQKCNCAH